MESPTNDLRAAETPFARTEVPASASPGVRCILTLPESMPAPPADLVEAFSSRKIEVRECVGVFTSMALTLELQGDTHAPIALVVVEPTRFAANRAEELLHSVEKYAPRVARWVYEVRASPRLRKWVAPSPHAEIWSGTGVSPVEPARVNGIHEAIRDAEGRPPLRLTEQTADTSQPALAPPFEALTEEELAMLLGPSDPDVFTRLHARDVAIPPD